MPSDLDFTISSTPRELETARRLVREGRLAEAERAFRRVLETQPDQIEALRFLANAALARDAVGEAVDLLNRAAVVDRNDIGVLMELGVAYRAADRRDESRYVLERALQVSNGRNTTARLLLANVLEQDRRPELAVAHYFRAIVDAQRENRWLDDDSTEPGLRQLVRHAMRYVTQGRRALFDEALQPLRQANGATTLARVERALSIYLRENGEAPLDPRQRPSFLYIPDLGASPFRDPARCDWLDAFRARSDECATEIEVCVETPDAMPAASASPFSLGNLIRDDAAEMMPAERHVPIYQRGLLYENVRACAPRLLAALDEAPLVRIPQHGPDAGIIVLAPDRRSPLRYGRTNSRCAAAIVMQAGPRIEILVGGEPRALVPGQAVVFDPSFGVEYTNTTGTPAHILTFEFWHPDLMPVERAAITAITIAAVDFDARLQELA